MTNKHLSDTEIQQYVFQNTNCAIEIAAHIQQCAYCKIKTEHYKVIFGSLKVQEKPVFDFDLAELVMEQLPQRQQTNSNSNSFFYFIISIALFFFCIIFYLFGNNLLSLFRNSTPLIFGLIITTATSLLVFLGVDFYRKYQIKMQALNFY